MQISRPAWQRVLAIFACLVFILCFYGRLTAQAVFVVDDLVIGGVTVASLSLVASLLLIGLAGSELEGPVGEAASAAGQNAKEFISSKAEQWINATQGDPTNFIKGIADAVLYNPDGTLVFGPAAGAAVNAFGNWLIDNGDITVSSTDHGNVSDNMDFTECYVPFSFTLSDHVYLTGTSNNYYVVRTNNPVNFTFFTSSSNSVSIFIMASSSAFSYFCNSWSNSPSAIGSFTDSSSSYTFNNKKVYFASLTPAKTYYSGSAYGCYTNDYGSFPYTIPAYVSQYAWLMIYGASSTGSTSGLDVWNDDTATDGWVLDPTGLIGDAVSDLTGAIANVGDYIDTLADVIAGVADVALPVAGVGDIPIPVVGDITIPVDPAIPADRADAVPTTGEQAGEDTPYAGTGDYTLPLADFFPFCIPFDIYKMLSLLAADPVAPSFTWQFYTPGGGTIPIDVDLSGFNSVASVLRAVEILAFCVGLGFVTKKLLFGS